MEPFYLLVFLGGLLVAVMLLQLLGVGRARLSGAPFDRRPFLTAAEADALGAVADAAGPSYRVFAKVAAATLLRPERGLRRGQRRLAAAVLSAGAVDLVIAAADGAPLCAVQLASPVRSRSARRLAARIGAGCAAAGMPVIELPVEPLPAPAEVARLVREALALVQRTAAPVAATAPVVEEEDPEAEALLADIAAAMREPDDLLVVGGRR